MNGTVIAVLILIVVVLVGWFAYSQGYFAGQSDDSAGIEVNLGGTNNQ